MLRRTLLKGLTTLPLFSLPRLPESKLDKKKKFTVWYDKAIQWQTEGVNYKGDGKIVRTNHITWAKDYDSVIPIYKIGKISMTDRSGFCYFDNGKWIIQSEGPIGFEKLCSRTLDYLKAGLYNDCCDIALYSFGHQYGVMTTSNRLFWAGSSDHYVSQTGWFDMETAYFNKFPKEKNRLTNLKVKITDGFIKQTC